MSASQTLRGRRRSYGVHRDREERPLKLDEQVKLQDAVHHGASAGHLADYTEGVLLPQQEGAIRSRMFAMIDSSEPLNAQKAVEGWIQLHSAYKLVKTLRTAQKQGGAAHKRLSKAQPKDEQLS